MKQDVVHSTEMMYDVIGDGNESPETTGTEHPGAFATSIGCSAQRPLWIGRMKPSAGPPGFVNVCEVGAADARGKPT